MATIINGPSLPDLKLIPAVLNKNLCSVAALCTYDLSMQQGSMNQEDQYVFCYNIFHGNAEKNMVSQIDVVLNAGLSQYKLLYDSEAGEVITDRNATLPEEDTITELENGELLVSKKRYSKGHSRYVCGDHFTKESFSCPIKSRLKEKMTGRNTYDLAMTCMKNKQKASAITTEWLDDGEALPSGKSWDDLYDHIISKSSDTSNKKSNYTGWIALEVLTRFNDIGVNLISASTPGEDVKDDCGCKDFQRKQKQQKDVEIDISVGGGSEINKKRGLSLEVRLHVIEMAQVKDEKTNAAAQQSIPNANSQLHNLLEERKQAIALAQSICPVYDKEDNFWTTVTYLTV